ncbi:MAG: transcriptional regulator, partial [Candidatus Omnitrophica bacterium]|nr:transcriptional regulator [Candidatus Omnitrophota bacterium]MCA9432124.1 transcriptional regulator [Candidatus Omnitrophota bacterium]MCA9449608.1 transcriptional regulator [Candidatus Omnitrophota bacterium]MCB9766874.1 transcriptional regulator [Candidatus Omnitrophota bacterium]MCB9782671.1 transcriptional regulator [Candidatus Omnitrophota bacterium]
MKDLDPIIHQPIRLKMMASLVSLSDKEKVEFTHLRDLLELTDGNMGAHLIKLEEAKYVKVEKTFVGRKPKTYIHATSKGRSAFEDHVEALKKILLVEE